MPSKISITIVQMKPRLGNIEFNTAKILEYYDKSQTQIILFPELSITGYSPRDQLLSQKFIENCHAKVDEIMRQTSEKICIIGTPFFENGKLYNAVLAMQNGKIIAKSFKTYLPNYEVFEEMRYFTSGNPAFFTHNGVKFGLPICEDIWHDDVCQNLKNSGVDVLLVANASPFHQGKSAERHKIAKKRF
jgi:predicted amidohydrolase